YSSGCSRAGEGGEGRSACFLHPQGTAQQDSPGEASSDPPLYITSIPAAYLVPHQATFARLTMLRFHSGVRSQRFADLLTRGWVRLAGHLDTAECAALAKPQT